MSTTLDFRSIRYIPMIKFSGIFDQHELMKIMRNWIVDQGYEFHEKSVKHKIPSPTGAEQEFVWWGWRKVNSYVKFHIDVFFHLWDIHDVEIVKDGKKQKLQSARLQIEMSGRCELDWANRFGGSPFLNYLANFYNTYIVRHDVDTIYTDQLYYRVYKLAQIIKEFLEFETKKNAFEDMW